MKKLTIIVFVFGFSVYGWGQKKVNIPFFGKMEMKELCGDENCSPSYGVRAYVHKKDRLYYNGDYNSVLGRKFVGNKIFNSSLSGLRKITDKEVTSSFKTKGTITIKETQKKDFDAKLTADLKQALEAGITLPEELKVKLFAKLNNYVKTETKGSINFVFEILELQKGGEFEKEVNQVFSTLVKGEKLLTGISVVTIDGNWEKDVVKNILTNFEMEVGLNEEISAEAKLKYEKSKQRLIAGTITPFSFIIGDSYLIK